MGFGDKICVHEEGNAIRVSGVFIRK